MKDIKNYSLLGHNTFGIEATCSRFLEYATAEEAREVAAIIREEQKPYLIIGGGSNLLLTADYEGTVVHAAVKGMEPTEQADGTLLLRCGAGEVWDDVVAYSVEQAWHGAENLSIIPGEVGASAVQNIGAYGAEVKDLIA
jgi:UDP-N-acetylmuramate dehydrogenase